MTAPTQVTAIDPAKSTENIRQQTFEDEFVSVDGLDGLSRGAADRALLRYLSDIEEMERNNRWEDIVSLFSPVEEKAPEVAAQGLDVPLRLKLAFALGHLKRFDEAIQGLLICAEKEPANFSVHAALGYAAYNSLYAAKNREVFLSGKSRQDRLDLAHLHLRKAQELKPEGVTNYYREGMLFKQIEAKIEPAIPLFERAITNWELLSPDERGRRHQERKNYVKSLYNLGSALLQTGKAERARELLDRCMEEDRESDYISPLFKYFALGKVLFHLNRFPEAGDALNFALTRADGPADFVHELLARTYLSMGEAPRAQETIQQVPEKSRRPYYRWTEADVWCALKEFGEAKRVLHLSMERDRRSKHKTLIRLAKIEYLLGRFDVCWKCASEAIAFFEEKWGTLYDEGVFWQALALFRLGQFEKAKERAMTLKTHNPRFHNLDLLLKKLPGEGYPESNKG